MARRRGPPAQREIGTYPIDRVLNAAPASLWP
jgi:hypothetical protein